MPRYNDDGFEYTYYIGELYSSISHGDYVCSGAYTDCPDSTTGSYSEYVNGTQKDTIALVEDTEGNYSLKTNPGSSTTGTIYYVAEFDNEKGVGGTIVNKLKGEKTVSGTKVWSGLPNGFDRKNLPNITFNLYRTINASATDDTTLGTNGWAEVTDSNSNPVTATLKSGSSTFTFAGTFPKYDNEGNLYYYTVREVGVGTETSADILKALFNTSSKYTNGITFTNNFIENQHYSITFTKTWVGVPEGLTDTQLPGTEIILVRYSTNGGSTVSGSREVVSATVNGNTNANPAKITMSYGSNNTIIWNNIAYYAPNGQPYQYKVEEKGINGYTVYTDVNCTNTNQVSENKSGSGIYEATVTGTYDSVNKQGSGSAALTNKYGEVLGSVSVTKAWKSAGNYKDIETSLSNAYVKLSGKSEDNNSDATITDPVAVLKTSSLTKTWESLEIYAPNGSIYNYSAAEYTDAAGSTPGAPTGYTVIYTGNNVNAAKTPKVITVTNTQTTKASISVKKAWKKTVDGGEPTDLTVDEVKELYALCALPKSIVFTIQYSTDNGTNWQDLADTTGENVQITLTYADGTYASGSLKKLPDYICVNNAGTETMVKAEYRAYESVVSYADNSIVSRTDNTIGSLTVSEATSDSNNAFTTTATNTIQLKTLNINKTWKDNTNRNNTRTNLIFTIDRTKTNTLESDVNGSTTITLTSKNQTSGNYNEWTGSLLVPVYCNLTTESDYKSSYKVTETTQIAGYTTYADTKEVTQADTLKNNFIDLGSDNTTAYFLNKDDDYLTADVEVYNYFNSNTAKKENDKSILNDLAGSSYQPEKITFKLQYRTATVGASATTYGTWTDVDKADNKDVLTAPCTVATSEVAVGGDTNNSGIFYTKWTGLPRYVDDGNADIEEYYEYRVIEITPKNYTAVAGVSKITGTDTEEGTYSTATYKGNSTAGKTLYVYNDLPKTSVTIEKTWDDDNNTYGTRPASLSFKLNYKSVEATEYSTATNYTATMSSNNTSNKLTATITGVPVKDANGNIYSYQVVEDTMKFGTTTVNVKENGAAAGGYTAFDATATGTPAGTQMQLQLYLMILPKLTQMMLLQSLRIQCHLYQ